MIEDLIEKELKRSTEKHNHRFCSSYEGYAVIKEEIEELEENLAKLNERFSDLWGCIKSANLEKQARNLGAVKINVLKLIKEAIQIAAMCDKFRLSRGNLNNKYL